MIQRPFLGNLLCCGNYVTLSLVNFSLIYYFIVPNLRFCIPIVFFSFVT